MQTYSEANYRDMDKHVIFNIGRQYGSGGKAVADEIGRKLGIKVYDNELLHMAAEKSGFSESLFNHRDEKRRLWKISNIFGANRYGYGSSSSGLNDGEIFMMMSDLIRDIAQRESAIFVGRASNYVLRDMDCCLDVFITAPLEYRKKKVSEKEGISLEEAEAFIEKRDRHRAEYYNFFTLGHWGKAVEYDLCMDASILGPEKTADFIINFAREQGLL